MIILTLATAVVDLATNRTDNGTAHFAHTGVAREEAVFVLGTRHQWHCAFHNDLTWLIVSVCLGDQVGHSRQQTVIGTQTLLLFGINRKEEEYAGDANVHAGSSTASSALHYYSKAT